MQKLLIFGLGEDFSSFFSVRFPFGYFNIVSCTDFDSRFQSEAKLAGGSFCTTENALKLEYDKILICDRKNYNNIYKRLVNEYGISENKILTADEISGFMIDKNAKYKSFSYSFGKKNPDKTFFVIRPLYSMPLFSMVKRCIGLCAWAEKNNYIPVADMYGYKNIYKKADENAWENYFRPLSERVSMKEVCESKNVIFHSDYLFENPDFRAAEQDFMKSGRWKDIIRLNTDMQIMTDDAAKKLFSGKGKVLAMVCRGTNAMKPEENTAVVPEPEKLAGLAKVMMNEWDYEYVYLVTEDETIWSVFSNILKDKVLFTERMRYSGMTRPEIMESDREYDGYLKGVESILDVMLAVRCDSLLCYSSDTEKIVRMYKKNWNHCAVIDTGKYSDEEKTAVKSGITPILWGGNNDVKSKAETMKEYGIEYVYADESYSGDTLCGLPVLRKAESVRMLKNPSAVICSDEADKIAEISETLDSLGVRRDLLSFYTEGKVSTGMLKSLKMLRYTDLKGNQVSIVPHTSDKIEIVFAGYDNIIDIGSCSVMTSLKINANGSNGSVHIGNNNSFVNIRIDIADGDVTISNSCMFSFGITLFQSDMHPIFDALTRKRINKAKNIFIGNHVWVGKGVNLLGGASIGSGSICGANAVTSSAFPSNVIIAGSPASVVRRNVIWAKDVLRDGSFDDFSECRDQEALKYLDI